MDKEAAAREALIKGIGVHEKAALDEFIKKHKDDLEKATKVLADGAERLKQIKENSAREEGRLEYVVQGIQEGMRREKEAKKREREAREAEDREREARG